MRYRFSRFIHTSALLMFAGLIGCTRPDDNSTTTMGQGKYSPETQNHEWFVFVTTPLSERLNTDIKTELSALVGKVAKEGDVIHAIAAPDHNLIATMRVLPLSLIHISEPTRPY